MSKLYIKKVTTLPLTIDSNTLYIVSSPYVGYAEMVISNIAGDEIRRIPNLDDINALVDSNSATVGTPNKYPMALSDGTLDNTWVNPVPSQLRKKLHRSPNAITALFIYDTTKDSDGGAWTDKCQHTSWYNEPLCGKWLGAVATESAARAVTGATTNDYFQRTTNGVFYKLNAGSGITQVYRGNKANFPKIAAIVAENSGQVLTIYDLTEPNYPMWMTFIQTVSTNHLRDFIRGGIVITAIHALNGYVGLSLGSNGGFGLINFPQDLYEKPGTNRNVGISKRTLSNTCILGTYGYKYVTFGEWYYNSIKMTVLPGTIVENGLARPTIILTSGYNGGDGAVVMMKNNKSNIRSSNVAQYFNKAVITKYAILASVSSNNSIYYALNPGSLGSSFSLTTVAHTAPPYFNDAMTAQLKLLSNNRYMIHGSQNSVRHLLANYSNYARSLTMRAVTSEQTGWLAGDIRRCYMGDNSLSGMTTEIMAPPILNARLVQRLGGESRVWSLLSLGNGIVLAGTNPTGQVYRSTDNGLSFTLVQRLGSETHVLLLLSLGNGIVLAGTNPTGQVYRSTDNGLSFTLVQRLGSEPVVFSLVSLGNGVILAGTASTGQVYRSTDNGLSFTLVQRLGSEGQVLSLVSLGNGIVLAGTGWAGQVYRSTDNGLSFTLVQRLGSEGQVLSLVSLGNGIVLAGTNPTGQVYRSTDNGLSFTLVQRLGSENQIFSLVSLDNGIVLAGTNPTGQVYRSTDNGLSFTLVQRLGSETYVLSLLSLGNGIVLAGTAGTGQIYRYTYPVISGTLIKTAVAPNADLTAYSGFTNAIYAREAYNPDLDFGTAEWTISAWIKIPIANAVIGTIVHRGYSSGAYLSLIVSDTNTLTATASDGTTTRTVTSTNVYNLDAWIKVRANYRSDGSLSLSVNAIEEATTYGAPLLSLTNTNAVLTIGNNYVLDAPFPGSLCLLKLSASVPTLDQMAFMYSEESQLFRDGAKCTLPDSTALVDLAYDDETATWSAVSANNSSQWNGLVRTSTSAVSEGSYLAIEAKSGTLLEARSTTNPGVDVSLPYRNLRARVTDITSKILPTLFEYVGGFTGTTDGDTTIFRPLSQTTNAWKGIASYKNDVYACVYGGDIYKQTNGTGNFVPLNQTSRNWNGMVGNGNVLYAYVYNGDVYKYNDTTQTFEPIGETSRPWTGMAICGNDIYACARGLDIYERVGGIGNFLPLNQGTLLWSGMTSYKNYVYAGVDGGSIYMQTNDSGTFTDLTQTNRYWTDLTATDTDVYATVNNGDIYKQTNGSGAFTATSNTSRAWTGITTNSKNLLASVDNGDIYKLNLSSTIITNIASLSIPPETTHYEAIITGTGIPSGTQLYNIVGTTGYISKPTTANGSNVQISFTDFILPVGYSAIEVFSQGLKKQEGATKDYTRLHDGFRETIRFNTAPGYTAWIKIYATLLTQ